MVQQVVGVSFMPQRRRTASRSAPTDSLWRPKVSLWRLNPNPQTLTPKSYTLNPKAEKAGRSIAWRYTSCIAQAVQSRLVQGFGTATTHRPLSSSFVWFIFRILYKVIPKRNYLGAGGYTFYAMLDVDSFFKHGHPRTLNSCPKPRAPMILKSRSLGHYTGG